MTTRRHHLLPLLVLVVGAIASIGAAAQLWRAADARDRTRFEAESALTAERLEARLETQIALLRGAAGLFAASQAQVDRDKFNAYVEQLGLGARYPGVLGLGFSRRAIGPSAQEQLVREARASGFAGFRVWPGAPRDEQHSIILIEPFTPRNAAALGYDMFTNPTRREAMERARDTGQPALSGKVRLVQEIETKKQPGFLIYLPVYQGGDPGRRAERRARLAGFVYSPLRAHDLLSTLFPAASDRAVDVAVFDSQAVDANLLYRTAPARATRFTDTRAVSIAGRTWILRTSAASGFEAASDRLVAMLAGLVGLVATALVAWAALLQARAAAATERARAELAGMNAALEDRVAERTRALEAEMRGREAAEGQIRQMQKIEAVGQLTGGIAHDFNNMLAVVIGSLDMLRRRATLDARAERLVDGAAQGAQRAAALTARLLAFSRQQALAPTTLDANKLVAGMSELLRRTLGETIRIETVLAGGLWRTHADPGQLENAVLNLAVNARDAMPGGGRMTVETANRHLDEAYAKAHPDASPGQYVMVAVSDTGEGMPPEVLARAFDPFFTTKEVGRGTGLGLSQVFGFVKQSGGHVNIYSEPGAGTTVKIYLPRWQGAIEPEAQAVTESAELPRGAPEEVVLVVEDEDQVRAVSVEALNELGYTVREASSAAQALELLEEQPGAALLFTDIVMPDVNGIQLAQAAAERRPGLKVLFTTGFTPNAVVHNGVPVPRTALLSKPFTVEQLAVKVRAMLDADGAEAPGAPGRSASSSLELSSAPPM